MTGNNNNDNNNNASVINMCTPDGPAPTDEIFAVTTPDETRRRSRSSLNSSMAANVELMTKKGAGRLSLSGDESDLKFSNRIKVVNDPVHGHYELDANLFPWIDNVVFQRLRDLKQLGGMYLVFPGASHNRFEHSLGTCHLAGRWMRHFRNQLQREQKDIVSDRDIFLVEIAALCHDLGHGPYSHTFEDAFIANNDQIPEGWSHEDVSCSMVKLINDRLRKKLNDADIMSDAVDLELRHSILSDDEVKTVQNLIQGNMEDVPQERRFMYQIVHNGVCGIDVDKLDYMSRDCYSSHLPLGHDRARIMKFARVINGEICWPDHMAYGLLKLFETRFSLHKQMYSHRVVKSVELMIGDILRAADEALGITKILQTEDYNRYVYLTDSLLNDIERRIVDSENSGLARAQSLIARIRERNLYQLLTEVTIPCDDAAEQRIKSDKRVEELQEYFRNDPVVVCSCHYHYGMRDKNPLAKVFFISGSNPVPRQLDEFVLSKLIGTLPRKFSETFIRIYLTETDHDTRLRMENKWNQWYRSHRTELSSPISPKLKRQIAPAVGDDDDDGDGGLDVLEVSKRRKLDFVEENSSVTQS